MDEQLLMLGRERQADLDREARRFALADHARRERVLLERMRPWLRRVGSMPLDGVRNAYTSSLSHRTQEVAGSSPARSIRSQQGSAKGRA